MRRVKLGPGLRDVRLRGDAGVKAGQGQLKRLLVGGGRRIQKSGLHVDSGQRKIIRSQFRLHGEAHSFELGG